MNIRRNREKKESQVRFETRGVMRSQTSGF